MILSKSSKGILILIPFYLLLITPPNINGTLYTNATTRRSLRYRAGKTDLDPLVNNDDIDDGPIPEEEEKKPGVTKKLVLCAAGTATTCYGSALLLYSRYFPYQMHFMIMMRATGFNKIEHGIQEARKNIRQAVRSAIRHSPSLLMGAKSVMDIQDRIEEARQIMEETRKAKEDGIVTWREEKKIKRLKQKQINALKRDMKRLKRLSSSVMKIIQVLDFDEIFDVVKSFMASMTTVLAAGHAKSKIGMIIGRYCHFLNLASLILDTNRKIGFPLSRLLLTRQFSEDDIDEQQLKSIRNLGAVIVYLSSAFLIVFQNNLANQLNRVFIGSAILLRGLVTLASLKSESVEEVKEGDCDSRESLQQRLKGRLGGMLVIFFSIVGMYCNKLGRNGVLKMPVWFNPLCLLENAVKQLVWLADKIS